MRKTYLGVLGILCLSLVPFAQADTMGLVTVGDPQPSSSWTQAFSLNLNSAYQFNTLRVDFTDTVVDVPFGELKAPAISVSSPLSWTIVPNPEPTTTTPPYLMAAVHTDNNTTTTTQLNFTLHFDAPADASQPLHFAIVALEYKSTVFTSGNPSNFLTSAKYEHAYTYELFWDPSTKWTILDHGTLTAVPLPATAGTSLLLLAGASLVGGLRRFFKKA